MGIIVASGVVLVAAVLVSFWGLSRDGGSTLQVGTVVFEVSVPQEILLSEFSSGSMDNGAPWNCRGARYPYSSKEITWRR